MEVVISYYLWENISTNSRLNLWKLWQHQIVVKIFSFFWGLVEKFEKCVLEYIHARWVTWTGKMGRWWRLQTVLPQIKELFNFMFCQKIRGNQYGYKICLRREGTYNWGEGNFWWSSKRGVENLWHVDWNSATPYTDQPLNKLGCKLKWCWLVYVVMFINFSVLLFQMAVIWRQLEISFDLNLSLSFRYCCCVHRPQIIRRETGKSPNICLFV